MKTGRKNDQKIDKKHVFDDFINLKRGHFRRFLTLFHVLSPQNFRYFQNRKNRYFHFRPKSRIFFDPQGREKGVKKGLKWPFFRPVFRSVFRQKSIILPNYTYFYTL